MADAHGRQGNIQCDSGPAQGTGAHGGRRSKREAEGRTATCKLSEPAERERQSSGLRQAASTHLAGRGQRLELQQIHRQGDSSRRRGRNAGAGGEETLDVKGTGAARSGSDSDRWLAAGQGGCDGRKDADGGNRRVGRGNCRQRLCVWARSPGGTAGRLWKARNEESLRLDRPRTPRGR